MFREKQRAPRASVSTKGKPPGTSGEVLGRRERNKRAKLARIQQAARTLFGRHGVEGTTIRQIAEAADIGLGTVFCYAANKEDLLVSIFRDEVGRAVERAFATVRERPLLDQVLHVFDAIIVHHQAHLDLAKVFVKETPFIDDSRHGLREFLVDLIGGLERLVDQAKAKGELSAGVPSWILARNLFGIFFQHLLMWLGPRRPASTLNLAALRKSLELQLTGFRRRRPRRHRPKGGRTWNRRLEMRQ
jgi:AcrR family transcriptional regulator